MLLPLCFFLPADLALVHLPTQVKSKGEPSTLYSKGRILGYKRSKVNQYENTSLIKIEHVNQRSDTDFYLGKRCVARPVSSLSPLPCPVHRHNLCKKAAADARRLRALPPLPVAPSYRAALSLGGEAAAAESRRGEGGELLAANADAAGRVHAESCAALV